MKTLLALVCGLVLPLCAAEAPEPAAEPTAEPAAAERAEPAGSDMNQVSYAIGFMTGQGMKKQGLDIVQAEYAKGFADGQAGKDPAMTEKEMEEMHGFFSYIEEAEDPKSLCIIFTSEPPFKITKGVEKFIIKTPAIIDEGYLKLKILNKRAATARHNKQHRDYDRKIFRLLKMLKVLKSEGVLYIADMCNEFNVSPKTVRRDIELWNALGEIIEYDQNKKGYILAYSNTLNYDNS